MNTNILHQWFYRCRVLSPRSFRPSPQVCGVPSEAAWRHPPLIISLLKYVCVLFVFASVSAYAAGVLIETKGTVEITVSGKKATPKVGLELPDGSKVKPGVGAKAQVMLLDGSLVTVTAGEVFTIGPKADPQKKRTTIEGIQIAMNEVAKTGRGPTVQGMVKMGQPNVRDPGRKTMGASTMGIEGLFPVNTAIEPSDAVTFRWSPTTKIDWPNPILAIRDENKTTIMVEPIVANISNMTISWTKMGLKAGASYKWHLGYKEGEKIIVKGNHFPFKVTSDGEQQALATDLTAIEGLGLETPAGKNLLLAQVYYKYGLYQKTVESLAPLSAKSGATVKNLLYISYRRMGLIKEMRKYE